MKKHRRRKPILSCAAHDKKLSTILEKPLKIEFFKLIDGVNEFNTQINAFLIVPAFVNEEQFEEWRKDKKYLPKWLREPFNDTAKLLEEYFYVLAKLAEYKLDREILRQCVFYANKI